MSSVDNYHDVDFFLDRQIQNKLLDIDDQLWITDYMVESKGQTDVKATKTIKVSRNEDIAGWFCNSKIVLRKPEKEKPVQQPITHSWREQNRLKNLMQDNFVFKHYPISKSYIEQYREENSQLSGLKSPITGTKEPTELKKVGLQNNDSSPTQTITGNINSGQSVCSQCNLPYSTNSQTLITAAFNYTRRETTSLGSGACRCNYVQCHTGPHSSSHSCSKHKHHNHNDAASHAYKYKLTREHAMINYAWKSESEHSSDVEKDSRTPRALSGKRSAGKSPTKVTVPCLPSGNSKNVQTVTV